MEIIDYVEMELKIDTKSPLFFMDYDAIAIAFWVAARSNDWENRGD